MKNKLTLLLVALTYCTSGFTQNIRSTENVGFDEISIIELAQNGDAWVGSNGQGLAFYEAAAQQWTYYDHSNTPSLPGDSITGVALSSIGNVQHAFISTTAGLCYNHAGGFWDTLGPLPNNNVRGVLYRADSLWALTPGGFTRFDSSQILIQNYPAPFSPVTCMQKAGNCGGFWAGTANNGCFYTANGTTFSYIDTSAPNQKLVDNRITAIAVDNICVAKYIGTRGGFSVCPVGNPCQNFTTANGLPQNEVNTVMVDCQGRVWIGLRDSGVVVYNNPGFTRITTADGLPDNRITAIAFSNGCSNIWVGSRDGNVAQLDSNENVIKVLSGINKVSADYMGVYTYPQPANEAMHVTLGKEVNNATFIVVDLNGRAVAEYKINNQSNFTLPTTDLQAGLYIYRLLVNGVPVNSGKLQVLH